MGPKNPNATQTKPEEKVGESNESPPSNRVPAGHWAAANEYLDLTLGKDFNQPNVLAAVASGTNLVLTTGSWLPAL